MLRGASICAIPMTHIGALPKPPNNDNIDTLRIAFRASTRAPQSPLKTGIRAPSGHLRAPPRAPPFPHWFLRFATMSNDLWHLPGTSIPIGNWHPGTFRAPPDTSPGTSISPLVYAICYYFGRFRAPSGHLNPPLKTGIRAPSGHLRAPPRAPPFPHWFLRFATISDDFGHLPGTFRAPLRAPQSPIENWLRAPLTPFGGI